MTYVKAAEDSDLPVLATTSTLGRDEPHDAVLRSFIKFNEVADSMRVLLTIHKGLSDLN